MKYDEKELLKHVTTDMLEDYVKNLRLDFPSEYATELNTATIHPYLPHGNNRSYPLIATHQQPILYKNKVWGVELRIPPQHPTVAVSKDGLVVNVVNGKELKKHMLGAYPRIYVPTKVNSKRYNTTMLHRLVALTWVPNDNFIKNNLVDHIDGNKFNANKDNLRWVSPGDNLIHGQAADVNKWVVKNITTGVIRRFHSLTDMEECTGYDRRACSIAKCPMYFKTSQGEWLLDHMTKFSNFGEGAKHTITGYKHKALYHLHLDGVLTKTYPDTISIVKDHGRAGKLSFKDIQKLIHDYYKKVGIKATVQNMLPKEPSNGYTAFNLITKKVASARTMAELAKEIGVPKSTVISRFSSKKGYAIRNWVFKTDDEAKYTVRDSELPWMLNIAGNNIVFTK